MKVIGTVPLGGVEGGVLEEMEVQLWRTFGLPVTRLPAWPEPFHAYDAQRGQYSSAIVLRALQEWHSPACVRVLGVTECDLCMPMLTFVFGHAQVNGRVAVVSLARLRQEFYGLPPNRSLLLRRAGKEAVHEIGHTFNLIHCGDPACPMSLSNAVSQVDDKGEELCKSCSIILEQTMRSLRPDADTRGSEKEEE